jgi:hypothetical protein
MPVQTEMGEVVPATRCTRGICLYSVSAMSEGGRVRWPDSFIIYLFVHPRVCGRYPPQPYHPTRRVTHIHIIIATLISAAARLHNCICMHACSSLASAFGLLSWTFFFFFFFFFDYQPVLFDYQPVLFDYQPVLAAPPTNFNRRGDYEPITTTPRDTPLVT